MNNICLIEDHDKALKIWKKKNIKSLDLVHLDAHMDFGVHPARPIERIVQEAKSIKELKQRLEYTLSFLHYEKDFHKQTDVGNYIYPAMQEGIVNNFYWVVPGGIKEFRSSFKLIKGILRNIVKEEDRKAKPLIYYDDQGIISARILGRVLTVCILEKLPILTQEVLLDIDTDFLMIDSIINADNTKNIGKRKPWILPQDLVKILREKVKNPKIITIAYSVNGGWTPMKYKYLADALAYHFAPGVFKERFTKKYRAARYFNLFNATGKSNYYRQATRLNSTYRLPDNNYGRLYLSVGRLTAAQSEFERILKVDRKNPACFSGLGTVSLIKKDFLKTRKYFLKGLDALRKGARFNGVKKELVLGLAQAEFYLKHFKQAKELLLTCRKFSPLQPRSYYLLGKIYERRKEFYPALNCYKDSIRLGFDDIEPLYRIAKIYHRLEGKDRLMKFIVSKYKDFKNNFNRLKRLQLKKKSRITGLRSAEKKILALEGIIKKRRW